MLLVCIVQMDQCFYRAIIRLAAFICDDLIACSLLIIILCWLST